jgi:uncharacterized protein (TIGR00251 family)
MFQDEAPNNTQKPGRPACRARLKVVPGGKRDEIVGPLGDRLKIKVAAPPEDGKANRAVCRVLARALGVGEREVTILAGASSPEKTARIEGLSAAEATARIAL